jgi:DNA adenine methylase
MDLDDILEIDEIVGAGINAPFSRIGGKSRLKKRIVDEYFPKDYENMIYVEPFIGAGSIYFYKEPSKKEVINDLDDDIITLLKGFKKYDGNEISKLINYKWSKKDFEIVKNSNPDDPYLKFLRLLFLKKTSFFGNSEVYTTPRHIHGIRTNYGDKYNERMKKTIITNQDYKKLISKYDSPNTFFYLDPPYEKSTGLYAHDVLPIKDVYDTLKNIKGKFLISYNDSKEAKELFKNYNIKYIKTTYRLDPSKGGYDKIIKEMLISNY